MARHAQVGARSVVVTGGAGFIGSHLCDALLARGDTVTCVDNLVATAGSTRNIEDALAHPGFEIVTEDVLDWADRADLTGVDCVFHLAASKHSVSFRDPERDLTVNALATLRLLLRAARDGVARFVHGSTGSVYGETGRDHVEDAKKEPVSLYGVSKLAGETYCRVIGESFGLDYTVLRYYHVIGPRQDDSDLGGVVPIFVRRCLEGRPLTIYGTGAQTRSFTSVHDAVRVTVLASMSAEMRNAEFNCASGISISVQELADFVRAEMGSTHPIEYAPRRSGDIQHCPVDNTKVAALGVVFDTDWRSIVREVIASLSPAVAASPRALTAASQRTPRLAAS